MKFRCRKGRPMINVLCPCCSVSMGIEENEPNTEWECPTCHGAFQVQKAADGTLQCVITSSGKSTTDARFSAKPSAAAALPLEEEIPDDACVFALERLLKGDRPRDIRDKLSAAGHSAKQ